MKSYPKFVEQWLTSQATQHPSITHDALTDIEVQRTAVYMLEQQAKNKSQPEAEALQFRFIDFCSRACDLVWFAPPAAKMRGALYYDFLTPGELAKEVRHIGRDIESLTERLREHQSWFHAHELLSALEAMAQHPRIADPENSTQTLPAHSGCAGRNGWRNYLYLQIHALNDATQSGYSDSFVSALASALSRSGDAIEPGNARYLRKGYPPSTMDDPA